MSTQEIGETVKEHLRLYPAEKSKTIARMIHKKYPHLGNIELIRGRIRYYRGSSGVRFRDKIASQEFFEQPYKPKIQTDAEIIKEIIKSTKLRKG
jgi:hypothetical protein